MQNKVSWRMLFVFMTVFLDAVGFGIIFPVMPDLMRRFATDTASIALYTGYFLACFAVMQFLASPALGTLSDRYGRRPVLLVSLIGGALDYLAMAFAPSLAFLFAGRMVSGITSANATVASAYVADISTDADRSFNFSMIGVAGAAGMVTGPVLGGLLGDQSAWLGASTPFVAAAILTAINFLIGVFVLPESLTRENRRELQWQSLNPFPAMLRAFGRPELTLILLSLALYEFAEQVNGASWALYNQLKFGWSTTEIGASFAFVGIWFGINSAWASRYLIPRFGELRVARALLLLFSMTLFGFCFATRTWMMYVTIIFFTLSSVALPAIFSLVTRITPADRQGEIQGVLSSIRSFSLIIGPLFYSYLSKVAMQDFLGVSYFAAGIVGLAAWIAILRAKARP